MKSVLFSYKHLERGEKSTPVSLNLIPVWPGDFIFIQQIGCRHWPSRYCHALYTLYTCRALWVAIAQTCPRGIDIDIVARYIGIKNLVLNIDAVCSVGKICTCICCQLVITALLIDEIENSIPCAINGTSKSCVVVREPVIPF